MESGRSHTSYIHIQIMAWIIFIYPAFNQKCVIQFRLYAIHRIESFLIATTIDRRQQRKLSRPSLQFTFNFTKIA